MRLRTFVLVVVVLLAVVSVGVFVAVSRLNKKLPVSVIGACEVVTPSGAVALDFDQMANAATIAAVGLTRRVPDRAIMIALATALQESKLENLDSGDRDSVGLFQQRPSQGWGEVEQIQDPRYASARFYNALAKVKDWQTMRVTEAAQRVQRSAYPEAYEKWADEAQVLVEALSGQAAGAVSCAGAGQPVRRGAAATESLGEGLRLDWGTITTVADSGLTGLAVAAGDERAGWQFAHWIVAHSAGIGVQRVSYDGQQWSAESGAWTEDAANAALGHVVAEVYGGQ